ncbi:urotensin II-related peptide isoform X2 [Brienomyrus brachyistius]|uniref:urotensin II-related peptide isoform X2 n=1 Tax=Brienomyrus brachyistius TaxID=42636 RepID=UPI0020B3F40C|nr:urotensin II-related peptide isoform X2 [Brienomyrus brachyistius]
MSCKAVISAAVVLVLMTMVTVTANGAPFSLDIELTRGDGGGSPEPVQAGSDTPAVARGDRREKILRVLASLEDLQRSINKTRRSKITMIPRGVRGPGKKSKGGISDEAMRTTTTTAPPVDDCSTTSQQSDNANERHSQGGKGHKKAAPQAGKKPNKRVCFWKYCSQN